VLILNQYIILILPGLNSIKCLNDCKTLFLQEEDYVGEIKGGLRPTMRLIVMGIVHKQPKRLVYQTHLSVCLSVCHSLSLSLCVCVCVCVCFLCLFINCHIAHPEWLGSLRTRRAFSAFTQWASCIGDSTRRKHGCQPWI